MYRVYQKEWGFINLKYSLIISAPWTLRLQNKDTLIALYSSVSFSMNIKTFMTDKIKLDIYLEVEHLHQSIHNLKALQF